MSEKGLENDGNHTNDQLEASEEWKEQPLLDAEQPVGVENVEAQPLTDKKKKEKKRSSYKRRSRMKKIIVFIILLIIVAIGAAFILTPKPEVGIPVTTSKAKTMTLQQVVTVKGTIQGADKAEISSAVNYDVVAVNVKEGDRVKKGQILAVLNDESLQADYDKAQKNLEQSKYEYEAAQKLYDAGAISEEDYTRKKTAFENDTITANSVTDFDKTKIKSPIDGTVTRVNTSLGRAANDTVNKEAMFVIEDLDHLQMKVQVSEYDIAKIKVGQSVTITSDVMGEQSVTGTVSKISPTGEQKAQSTEMVIPVTIDVNRGTTKLMAGVTGKATILIKEKQDALAVPVDALFQEPNTGENVVFTVNKENKLKMIPVTLGVDGNLNVEIASGDLKAGDQVVLSPTVNMKDGMLVTPTLQQ